MENAADAIKMAGAVLLFVLALSIVIPFFSQARETTDLILDARDRETTYINGNYYYKATGNESIQDYMADEYNSMIHDEVTKNTVLPKYNCVISYHDNGRVSTITFNCNT